ncbi:NACHT and WD repeat domain-containing protein [Nocardia sp. NPDC127526]|uniref:NACHT and WD repeat domain-containing protein n=1 Tax=Nocardia sp. NPDC127526 TaxID=3345393 RepID=UPI00363FBC69
MAEPQAAGSPREVFARQLTELWECAGKPPLENVVTAANKTMAPARGAAAKDLRFQRFADWKAGRNVPADFETVWPVLRVLIDKAAEPLPPVQRQRQYWRRSWEAARKWAPEPVCPYRGLRPYRRADADRFFGRDRAIGELTEMVRTIAEKGGGIGILVGASGAGKSSLLAAGLVPRLEAGFTPVRCTPATGSRQALTTAVSTARCVLIIDQFEELFAAAFGAEERLDFIEKLRECASSGVTVVLGLRADFFARCLEYPILAQALANRRIPGAAQQDSAARSMVLVRPSDTELGEAIAGPARLAGLKLEAGLADFILSDLVRLTDADGAGALPLLSHVMAAIWEHRSGSKLTIAAYVAAGRVASSVAATADRAWEELDAAGRDAAQQMLVAMVAVGNGTRDTRRRVPRAELLTRTSNPEAAEAALDRLTRARLVVADDDTVTLVHEVVLDAWPRLRGWIDADREDLLVRQRTDTDAMEWEAAGRNAALLYRGTRLAQARASHPARSGRSAAFLAAAIRARRRRLAALNAGVLALVVALVAAAAGLIGVANESRKRDAEFFATLLSTIDRKQTSDPTLAAQLSVLAHRLRPDDPGVRSRLIASQAWPVAKTFAGHDGYVRMAYLADGTLAVGGGNGVIRLWNVQGAGEPDLIAEIAGHSAGIVTLIARGSQLISAGEDGAIAVHDLADPARPRQLSRFGAGGVIRWASLSRDRRMLVTTQGSEVKVWDLADSGAATPIPVTFPLTGIPIRAVFTSNGALLITEGVPGNLRSELTTAVWTFDPASGATRRTPLPVQSDVLLAEPAEDQPLVAVGDNGAQSTASHPGSSTVRILRIDDPHHPVEVGPAFPVTSAENLRGVGFLGDSGILATLTPAGLTLWNLADLTRPVALGLPLTGRSSACTAPDGRCGSMIQQVVTTLDERQVAIGYADGTVAHWSLPASVLAGQAGHIGALTSAVSARGGRMITGGPGADARIWDISRPAAPRLIGTIRKPGYRLPGRNPTVGPTISPDGRFVAVVQDDLMRMLDITDPGNPRIVHTFEGALSIGFGVGDRPLLVSLHADPVPAWVVWDYTDPGNPVRLGAALLAGEPNDFLVQLAPSRDGRIAVGLTDVLQVWVPDAIEPAGEVGRVQLGPRTSGTGLAVSPDGRMVAAGWDFGTVRLWDISTPDAIVPLGDPLTTVSSMVNSVDFAPDGRTLAVGGRDGTVQLWDVSDPETPVALGDSLNPPGEGSWHVAFHPDGEHLIGGGDNGALRIWNLDPARAVERICDLTGSAIDDWVAAEFEGRSFPRLCS